MRRNLFFFLFIVVVLVAGKWIRDDWAGIQRIIDELPALRRGQDTVSEYRADAVRQATDKMRALNNAGVQRLDAEIRACDDAIRRLQQIGLSFRSPLPEQLAEAAKREIDIALLRQQRQYLHGVRTYLAAAANVRAAHARLEQLRQGHVKAERALHDARRQLAQLEGTGEILARIYGTSRYAQRVARQEQVQRLAAANHAAYLTFRDQQVLVARLPGLPAVATFQINTQALDAATAPLRQRLAQAEKLAAENFAWQAYQAARPVLPAALGVLLGWWLVPAAIRSVFYFVLAPLAARLPPIVIQAGQRAAPATWAPAAGGGNSLVSAVSRRVLLAPGHELLIRPEYCQSQPAQVTITTTILFDWRRWLTSIAAHLWMLKRLRAERPADIVVSSALDPLDELALIEIAAGEAFVLQPRGLVGVLYRTGQRPAIRSHWRLGTLHAWLTLQLRYLAFEGPATLIVKGCRGVRLESARAGRTVSQDATLGFSANALYATVRAEPFLPYLRGRQPLLHDRFDGPDAYYLYEEVPRNARPGGRKRNPLEVLLEASLKAFGI